VSRLARFGLACRGVLYLVIAVLIVNMARGRGSNRQADSRGALETIAHHPFGHALVLAIGAGFGCLAVWQAVVALGAGSAPSRSGHHRLAAAGKAVIDGALCVSALAIAAHHQPQGGGDQQAADVTARVMAHSAGRYLVAGAGIAIGIAGVVMISKGLARRYDVEVRISDVPRTIRRLFEAVGGFGMLARGAVVVLLGYFVVEAAVTFNPAHATGLDGALASVLHDPWGPWLLLGIAAGLACFGLFSILEARYART
jgi:hypothetical protein